MPISNDCPKDSERLVNGGEVVTPAQAAYRQALEDGVRETLAATMAGIERILPDVASGGEVGAGGNAKPHVCPKPDRWRDNQAVVNLVLAAEDAVMVLSSFRAGHGGGRICECQCQECYSETRRATASLRAALRGME
jgi:hypothetical protein